MPNMKIQSDMISNTYAIHIYITKDMFHVFLSDLCMHGLWTRPTMDT